MTPLELLNQDVVITFPLWKGILYLAIYFAVSVTLAVWREARKSGSAAPTEDELHRDCRGARSRREPTSSWHYSDR